MALSFGRRKLIRREAGGHGCRCRHFHVHYHLPPRRACNFSLLRWLPRLSLLSCVVFPFLLFFAVLVFLVSFVWFTLLYFVAYLRNKDCEHGSFRSGSFGRVSADVDNHLREGGGQEGKGRAKGKALKHAAELLTGDSATTETSVKKLEIKEVRVDGFSEVSLNITRIIPPGASLKCEVRIKNDRVIETLSIFESGREEMHANSDSENFSGKHEVQDVAVDGFGDEHEHNIRVVSRSTSGDSLPSVYSINSAQIHDVPAMNQVIEMSSDVLVGSNQNMVVPSNTSPHPTVSHTNAEYGEELFEDRKLLSDCTPDGIIDFIDKHETRDEDALDSSVAKDEIVGLLGYSDGSALGRIPDEHFDGLTDSEHFDEHGVPDVPIIEANTDQILAASNEIHGFSNENETPTLSLHSVCEDTVYSSHQDNSYEDDKKEEATEKSIGGASDPASVACDFAENHQTSTRAPDDSANGGSTGEVVSRESSEDKAAKVNDISSSEGAPHGWPLLRLRRSPSQWWKLCGVVDVFAGSED